MKEPIKKEIGDIPSSGKKYYVADGSWSLFELIDYVLDAIGPSHILLTSFSLSEDSLRHILHLKEEKLIKSIRGLFDPSLRKTKTPQLFFAAEIFEELRFAANHSKIILFHAGEKKFTIMSSANLGRNRRIEAGVLDADASTYDFFYKHIADAFYLAVPL